MNPADIKTYEDLGKHAGLIEFVVKTLSSGSILNISKEEREAKHKSTFWREEDETEVTRKEILVNYEEKKNPKQ